MPNKRGCPRGSVVSRQTPNPEFYFDELVAGGDIKLSEIQVSHMEVSEVFAYLRLEEADVRAILFFPHYAFQEIYNDCQLLDSEKDSRSYKEMLLFARQSLLRNQPKAKALAIAIRNAWLELLESPNLLESATKTLLADQEYTSFLRRCAGLYQRPI